MSSAHSDFGLFRDFPEPVFLMDTQGTILDANEVFAARFFRTSDEIRGLNVFDLLCTVQNRPETAAYRKAKVDEAVSMGRHIFFDDEKDGVHWRNFLHPVRSSEGVITRVLVIAHDITIAKQEECQARKDNLVFRTLLDAIPGSVAILDAEGRLIGFNQYARQVFGKSESELYGSNPFEIIHPEDRETVMTHFRNIISFGSEESTEARVLMSGNPDNVHWFILHARKTMIDGQPFVVTVNIDIDERKRMENTLIENKRWLKLAMQAAQAGIWDRNLRTGENSWSDEIWKLIGVDKQKTPCSFDLWTSLIHPDDRERVIRTANIGALSESQNQSIEYRICRPDGSVRWMLSRGGPVRDGNGMVERMVGTTMDITERKLMEEELRRSHSRLDFTLAQCHLGWWEFNPATNTTERTIEHDRIFGYDTFEPEWHFERFLDHVVADDRPMVRRLCRQAHEKHEDFSFECRIRSKDGTIAWIWVAGGFQYDMQSGHHLMTGLVQDITDRKRQLEEQEKLQIELQQAQKMEVVGQLAGGIAHDFNNALTAIIGNTDLLASRVPSSFPYIENIRVIRKAAMRSANMTRQLLAFARKQIITPKVCLIDDEIENLLPMIEPLIGSRIQIIWKPNHARSRVSIDSSQLDQILINLCINARDAIADTGTITIETGLVTIDPKKIAASSPCQLSAGDYVSITVSDTGSGIEPEALPHIFEPFFTTKAPGIGTGLGLSTVYGILMQNKGCIESRTEPGTGSSFIVCLPLHSEAGSVDIEEYETHPSLPTENTILLVEDVPDILAILTGLLEEKGFRILGALNADAALRIARDHNQSIDLLVTDIMLPDMNGIALSAEIQSIRTGMKTLFMSGYAHDTRDSAAQQHHQLRKAVNFIQKPFSINSFIDMVCRMLNPENR